MRVEYAVFSDIHGNAQALETVWRELTKLHLVDRPVLNAGDNVGYGEAPEACIHFLQAHAQILTVQGNYDKHVGLFPKKETEYRKKWGKVRPEKFEAIQRDSAHISETDRAWLLALPKERNEMLDDTRILLTHYAPGCKEGLGSWTPDQRLQELAEDTSAQVVVCGHTHSPFVRSAGGVLFVNPGTLGRSRFGGACYAVLMLAPGMPPTASLRQVTS